MGFSASRVFAIAATAGSALVFGAGPGIAQPVAAKPAAAIGQAQDAGALRGGTGHGKWHATAQNNQHQIWQASDRQRARAKQKALRKCRTSTDTPDPKSCHIISLSHGSSPTADPDSQVHIGDGSDRPRG
jgi:hypothetical protein